jgi:hypothetical protein
MRVGGEGLCPSPSPSPNLAGRILECASTSISFRTGRFVGRGVGTGRPGVGLKTLQFFSPV